MGSFIPEIFETQGGRGALFTQPDKRGIPSKTKSINRRRFFIGQIITFHPRELKEKPGLASFTKIMVWEERGLKFLTMEKSEKNEKGRDHRLHVTDCFFSHRLCHRSIR
jgi:hypothetical protein